MRLCLVLALIVISVSMVSAAEVNGTWALTMQSPMGEENFDVVIKADGENLAVSSNHPMLQELTGKGTIKGNVIKFKLEATGQIPIAFEFTGTVEGDKMSGTREIKFSGAGGPGGPGGEGAPGGGMGDTSNAWSAKKK